MKPPTGFVEFRIGSSQHCYAHSGRLNMKNGIVVNSWTVLHVALLLVALTPGFNSTKLHLGNKSCDAHTISPLQGIPHFGSIDCVMMTFDLSRPCYRRGDWRRRREIVWRRRPRRIHRIDRQLPRCLGRAQGLFATYFPLVERFDDH